MATQPGISEEPLVTDCEKTIIIRPVKMCRFAYTWNIENYTSRDADKCEKISSPEFFTVDSGKVQTWCLETYPYVKDSRSKNIISIYLRLLKNTDDAELMATANCHVLNVDGKKPACSIYPADRMYNYTCGDSYAFRIAIDGDAFLNEANGLVIDGRLTILCEIDMMYNVVFKKTEVAKRHLVDDLARLLGNERSSDVTFNVSGRELPVHKAILGARSPVFSAMFEHDMTEDKQRRVDITDLEYEIVHEMLRYIYTGEVRDIEKFADGLLVAAEKYDLGKLKKMCATTLRDNITIDNAADILILAYLHRCDELKRSAIEFISEFTIPVMRTESFETILTSHSHLRKELFMELAQDKIATED